VWLLNAAGGGTDVLVERRVAMEESSLKVGVERVVDGMSFDEESMSASCANDDRGNAHDKNNRSGNSEALRSWGLRHRSHATGVMMLTLPRVAQSSEGPELDRTNSRKESRHGKALYNWIAER